MIIVYLTDGLGNQMFQYAAAKCLALTNHTELKIDISSYTDKTLRITPREFELDIFNLKIEIATYKDKIKFNAGLTGSSKLVDRIRQIIDPHFVYREKCINFDAGFFLKSKNTFLLGFFQSEKYFTAFEKQIRAEFTFKNQLKEANNNLAHTISKSESVAIHFRRGDYVNVPLHREIFGNCDINYYQKAIEFIKSKISDPVFYVFSDDIEWVKSNYKSDEKIIYVENNKAGEDLQLMSSCKYQIIANSSFSWWGAWLNKNPNKIVVAPKRWYVDDEKQTQTRDLIPEHWVQI